jgi:hypothetical protein
MSEAYRPLSHESLSIQISIVFMYHPADSRRKCNVENADPGNSTREEIVARKTVLVCDGCGAEMGEGKGAVMRVTFNDARRGAKQADLCDTCAGSTPGVAVARRGRKPKSMQ